MGILILVLTTILTVELVRRAAVSWNQATAGSEATPNLDTAALLAPAGAELAEVTATSSRAVLWFRFPDGGHRLVFVNPRTAEVTGSLDIGGS